MQTSVASLVTRLDGRPNMFCQCQTPERQCDA